MFRKLRDRDGTPVVSLVPDHLRRDGVLEDGELPDEFEIPDDREMFVDRAAEGVYVVLDTEDGEVPEVEIEVDVGR